MLRFLLGRLFHIIFGENLTHHIDVGEISHFLFTVFQILGNPVRVAVCRADIRAFLFLIDKEQRNQKRDARSKHQQGKHKRPLNPSPVEDIGRIAQRLHDRAHQPVIDKVKRHVEAVRLFGVLPGVRKKERRDDEIDEAFIKEKRIMPRSARDVAAAAEYLLKRQRKGLETAAARPLIDIHRKREKLQRLVSNLRAIYLLVGEVPPPADRLRQEQPHDDTVRRTEKIDF